VSKRERASERASKRERERERASERESERGREAALGRRRGAGAYQLARIISGRPSLLKLSMLVAVL
jgi:hypothetical protein